MIQSKSMGTRALAFSMFLFLLVFLLIPVGKVVFVAFQDVQTGAFTLVAANADVAATVFSQVKSIIRVIYSNPPKHGSALVAAILGDPELRAEWEAELAAMRDRIKEMRSLLVSTLASKGVDRDFSFIARQNGMFSFSGLNKDQVLKMREDSGVYAVDSGRFNVAAMTTGNMDALCDAIAGVID